MKPKIQLRIASISLLLHAIGHTVGALTWKKDPDPTIQQVVDAMINHRFVFAGALRSIGDFYQGYGITMTFVLLLLTVLLWQMATISVSQPGTAMKLLVPVSLSLLIIGLIEFNYFFFLPAILTSIAGLLAGSSALALSKNRSANHTVL